MVISSATEAVEILIGLRREIIAEGTVAKTLDSPEWKAHLMAVEQCIGVIQKAMGKPTVIN